MIINGLIRTATYLEGSVQVVQFHVYALASVNSAAVLFDALL